MAFTQRIIQISILLAALVCIVFSQDPALFSNMQASTSAATGQPGGFDMSALGGGMPMPPNFGMPPPAQPRPNPMQSMLPLLMFRGSDFAQQMMLMQMLGMGGGSSPAMGGMPMNPFLMYNLMKAF
ncbi:hypothetical protein Bpfe_019755 [Biomphalaria pfeifferi]|uniref:Uncharacterized protein n=1 Tax=Biomphalaria pfeifferi TaxID=112525 RepID=A0AAD8BA69_BIOPF|nr:hypothetical protein Bpfe_019755 [Biomphalaria pfeifferi]